MEIKARRIGKHPRTISGLLVSYSLCYLRFYLGFLGYSEIGFDLRILDCLIRVCLRIYCVLVFIYVV